MNEGFHGVWGFKIDEILEKCSQLISQLESVKGGDFCWRILSVKKKNDRKDPRLEVL